LNRTGPSSINFSKKHPIFPAILFIPLLVWSLLIISSRAGRIGLWGLIPDKAGLSIWLPAWLAAVWLIAGGLAGRTAFLARELSGGDHHKGKLSAALNRVRFWRFLIPLAVLVGWGLRSRNYFMGDGWALIGNVGKEFRLHRNEPLDFFLHQAFNRLLSFFGINDGALTYALLAVLLLPLFIWIGWKIICLVCRERQDRLAAWLILISTGCLQLFLGHVESYTLVNLFLCLFLYLGLKELSAGGRKGPWCLTAVTVLAVLSHLSALVLVPALVYVWMQKVNRPESTDRLGRDFWVIVGLAVAAAIVLLVLVRPDGLTPLRQSDTGEQAPFTLTDIRYLAFKLNLLLLLSPAIFVLLPFSGLRFGTRDTEAKRMVLFLMLAAGGCIFFFYTANAMLGLRDWDLLSLPALPLTVLGLVMFLSSRPAGSARSAWLGAAGLLAFGQIMYFAWSNMDQARGVDFLDRLRTHEIYAGTNMLQCGSLFGERGYFRPALNQYKCITSDSISNTKAYGVGFFYIKLGRPDSAIVVSRQAIENQKLSALAACQINAMLSIAYDLCGERDSAFVYCLKVRENNRKLQPAVSALWVDQLRSVVAGKGYLRKGLENITDSATLFLLLRLYAVSGYQNRMLDVYKRILECDFSCEEWKQLLQFSYMMVNPGFARYIQNQKAKECPELKAISVRFKNP